MLAQPRAAEIAGKRRHKGAMQDWQKAWGVVV
jgi:hypothetical protein